MRRLSGWFPWRPSLDYVIMGAPWEKGIHIYSNVEKSQVSCSDGYSQPNPLHNRVERMGEDRDLGVGLKGQRPRPGAACPLMTGIPGGRQPRT